MTQQSMIALLREAFGAVDRIDPEGPSYRRLCRILDKADDDALRAVHRAKIKFVSLLAMNRLIRRGLV